MTPEQVEVIDHAIRTPLRCTLLAHPGLFDIEDVTQSTWLRIMQHFAAFDPSRSSLSTWASMHARYELKDYCRKLGRGGMARAPRRCDVKVVSISTVVRSGRRDLDVLGVMESEGEPSVICCEHPGQRAMVRDAIKSLPRKLRFIAVQRKRNKTFTQIAACMGVTPAYIHQLYHGKIVPALEAARG